MPYLSYLHFFASIVYLYLAIFIVYKNPKALINRVCSAILFCFCIWSFGVIFVHNPSVSRKTALLFENIGALGWTTFSSFFLWFTLALVGKKGLSRSKYFILSIFILPLIFLYKQWSGEIISDHILKPFGWIGRWQDTIWPPLFQCYYFIMIVICLFFLFDFIKKTEFDFKKRQTKILIVSTIIPFILGTLSNVVMRKVGIYNTPPIGDVFILIWAFGMAYAISKYKLLSITPTVAADKIFSTMTDLLILLNPQGNIVSANNATSDLSGYETEELTGGSIEVFFPDDDAKADTLKKIITGGNQKNLELFFITKKGKKIPVSINTSVIHGYGIVCIARDITLQKNYQESLKKDLDLLGERVQKHTRELSKANIELVQEIIDRKKTEEELKDSEEKLKILFEFAPDAYYINDFSGTFIDGNKKAEELIGYKKEELIGKNFLKLKLLPASQIPKAAKALAKNALGQPTGPDEFVLNRQDGSNVHVEISTYPIKIKNKNLIIGIARDITSRKRDEEEKTKLEEQLHQAQKMEAIGQLAGGIAHDFNNMLGAISGYAEMIKRKFAEDNPTLQKYVNRVLDAAVRSADLTSKLLAFARKGKYEIVVVDIHETIREVLNLLEHITGTRIKVYMNFNANPATIMGDNSQLQNAILNIVVNSLDAMPYGGELEFTTDIVNLDETFVNSRAYKIIPGNYLKLSIADKGTGMDDEIKRRVFEPFFTTKETGKGTGLGLSGTYGIIKNHDGYIEIESEKGKGTTFFIYLPFVEKPTNKINAIPEMLQKGSGKILIIDDEELIRDITRDIVSEFGYSAILCSNGKEAVEYYGTHYKEIDLVFLDIILPEISGLECFKQLKKINPAIKVIVSSGHTEHDEADRIIKEGALGFIRKPFDINSLYKMINKALGK